jgi:hypothetical protein
MGNMPYVNEQIKAKYPNVIFDSTTIILENVDITPPAEPVPAGTIVVYYSGNFVVVSGNNVPPNINVPIGVILDYKDGKATILIRGLIKGKLYWYDTIFGSYQEHPQKLFPNVIKMED